MAGTSPITQRAILFGSRGMIGSALSKNLSGPNLVSFSHHELDITDYLEVEKIFLKIKPELVLNAAAFTRVDDCEKFRETAFLVNAQAPGHMAGLCSRFNALLVHLSTDFIFDGNGVTPYLEDDSPNPVNYYGVTKLEGEKKILSSGCSFVLVRTSWVFGKNGDNFVKKLLKRALAGAKLQAPDDQIGVPTYADDVATAILRLLSIGTSGIYHFTNRGECSRYEQAKAILQLYGLNNPLEAVKNDALRQTARRPNYSVLNISRYMESTGHTPRTWEQSTAEYIAFLKQNETELRS
jgi:dTDP-4-dehydrorhamnose reductase